MKDKPLFDLENEFETNLIDEVLTEENIPHRIALARDTYFGIILGDGVETIKAHAKLWGYEEDKEKIEQLLCEVRASQPIEDVDELASKCEVSEEQKKELADYFDTDE